MTEVSKFVALFWKARPNSPPLPHLHPTHLGSLAILTGIRTLFTSWMVFFIWSSVREHKSFVQTTAATELSSTPTFPLHFMSSAEAATNFFKWILSPTFSTFARRNFSTCGFASTAISVCTIGVIIEVLSWTNTYFRQHLRWVFSSVVRDQGIVLVWRDQKGPSTFLPGSVAF